MNTCIHTHTHPPTHPLTHPPTHACTNTVHCTSQPPLWTGTQASWHPSQGPPSPARRTPLAQRGPPGCACPAMPSSVYQQGCRIHSSSSVHGYNTHANTVYDANDRGSAASHPYLQYTLCRCVTTTQSTRALPRNLDWAWDRCGRGERSGSESYACRPFWNP